VPRLLDPSVTGFKSASVIERERKREGEREREREREGGRDSFFAGAFAPDSGDCYREGCFSLRGDPGGGGGNRGWIKRISEISIKRDFGTRETCPEGKFTNVTSRDPVADVESSFRH